MVIAALITFAILLVAWILAPNAPHRASEPAPEVTVAEAADPIAA
jgi:hypothetical protein